MAQFSFGSTRKGERKKKKTKKWGRREVNARKNRGRDRNKKTGR